MVNQKLFLVLHSIRIHAQIPREKQITTTLPLTEAPFSLKYLEIHASHERKEVKRSVPLSKTHTTSYNTPMGVASTCHFCLSGFRLPADILRYMHFVTDKGQKSMFPSLRRTRQAIILLVFALRHAARPKESEGSSLRQKSRNRRRSCRYLEKQRLWRLYSYCKYVPLLEMHTASNDNPGLTAAGEFSSRRACSFLALS